MINQLSNREALVLRVIAEAGDEGVTSIGLIDCEHQIGPAAMTDALYVLVARGFISLRPDLNEHPRRHRATPRGRALLGEAGKGGGG